MNQDQNPLAQLSDALAAAVETAGRSLVTVSARRRIPATGIAWREGGIVVTADHVIEHDDHIRVTLPDGTEVPAALAGRDPGTDVAVLRVQGGVTPATRAADTSARVGSLVLALGRPGSDGPQASFGVVSSVGGPWRTATGSQVEGYLRSDTTFYPGFSGGALVDPAGAVVGLNSSHLGRGGVTLPYAAVDAVVEALLAHGRVRRGYLGIGTRQVEVPGPLAAKIGGQTSGLLIMSVEPGSAADSAGLVIGDILVAVNGTAVGTAEDLQAQLGAERVGVATPLLLLRGGERHDATAAIGERSAETAR